MGEDITRIQICIATLGQKRFPCMVLRPQNTRRTGHEYEEKTSLLFLVLQKSKEKEHERDNDRHQSSYSKL